MIKFQTIKTSDMEMNYLCPYCRSHLKIGNELILTIKSLNSKEKGLLILDPQVGNYSLRYHPSIQLKQGEELDIHCPVCYTNLQANKVNPNLVCLIMQNKEGKEFEIYFSRIMGEHSTFVLENDNVIEKEGENISSYINYFAARYRQSIRDSS